jgi:hypothetical protein
VRSPPFSHHLFAACCSRSALEPHAMTARHASHVERGYTTDSEQRCARGRLWRAVGWFGCWPRTSSHVTAPRQRPTPQVGHTRRSRQPKPWRTLRRADLARAMGPVAPILVRRTGKDPAGSMGLPRVFGPTDGLPSPSGRTRGCSCGSHEQGALGEHRGDLGHVGETKKRSRCNIGRGAR